MINGDNLAKSFIFSVPAIRKREFVVQTSNKPNGDSDGFKVPCIQQRSLGILSGIKTFKLPPWA